MQHHADGAANVVATLRFGAAGDLLRTMPALEALLAAWPRARCLLVTHARLAPLASLARLPVEVVALARGEGLASLAERLGRLGTTHLLDLHGTLRSRALTLRMARGRRTVTWQKRSLGEWARVALAGAPHRPLATCAERQAAALSQLVGRPVALPPLALSAPGPRVARHPRRRRLGLGVGAAWASKRWPLPAWGELCRRRLAAGDEVWAFGSQSEARAVEAVCQLAPGVRPQVGLSWLEQARAMAALDAFACADSGPLHLAMGLGIASVGVFGPTSERAYDAVATYVVHGEEPCRPCSFFGDAACPRGHHRCLRALPVSAVEAAVVRALGA